MTQRKSPAAQSIVSMEIPSDDALRFADECLIAEGNDPLNAFVDEETNRHHRALALQADATIALANKVTEEVHPYIQSCEAMRRMRDKYPGDFR